MAAEFGELAGHDAYELLGVGPDASQEEIRRAYRSLVKAHHPDRHTDPSAKREAEADIRLLNAAHDALEKRRATYDAFRSTRDDGEPAEDEIIDDPWDAAEPGPASARDPWETATSSEQPVHVQWWPPPPPPPPPPAYVYSLGNNFYRPPVRRRRNLSKAHWVSILVPWSPPIAAIIILIIHGIATTPTPSTSVRERFSGTWKGKVKDVGDEKTSGWKAKLTLHQGRRNGEVSYLDGQCEGIAVPIRSEANRLTVSTEFTGVPSCDVGDFQVSRRKDGKLKIVYHDGNGKVTASGVLAPSG